ncbi:hypothetical protein [uncultured Weeksella sp.]|uniref:hypothetical protein n=1 Tax=uncultured Weeksella sp. TaxID=1161389 RepID=UPI00259BBA8E|nr:hypothetical protein [uncultured Weeksella sp.]
MRTHIFGWNFMRILRLVLGVLILLQAFFTKTWIFIFFGLLLSYTAWENIGCCREKACSLPETQKKTSR